MSIEKKVRIRKKRKALCVRNKLKRNSTLPRVSVERTLKHLSAQIIDDKQHKTLVSFSSLHLKDTAKEDKTALAGIVGQELAKKALEKGIERVCFDRGRYLYHGRVKALADGLRSGGVKF